MAKTEIRKKLMGHVTAKLIKDSVIYAVSLLVVLAGGNWIGHHVIVWQGTEPGYDFFGWVSEHMIAIGCILFLAGEILLLFHYFQKLCGYLEDTANAMEEIYQENQKWIALPRELSEIETRMNYLKQRLTQSRLQAKEAEQHQFHPAVGADNF